MDGDEIIARTEALARERLGREATGHDWWHTDRVRRMALRITREEANGRGELDVFVVELASLLHDLEDWKFHGGDEMVGVRAAADWLGSLGVDDAIIAHVAEIIGEMSFKGAGVPTPMRTREGAVVQDADRLDAIGAVGIARAFAYGAFRGNPLHDPEIAVEFHETAEHYKQGSGTTVNHFSEKLLFLRDRMNTETGRRIAADRHRFIEEFKVRFLAEWEGTA